MHRRTLLGAVAAGIGGLAGCSGGGDDAAPTETASPEGPSSPRPTATPRSTASADRATEDAGADGGTPERTEAAVDETPIRLLSVDPEPRARIGESVEYSFTLENPTAATRTVEPVIRTRSGAGTWRTASRLERIELAPGERRTVRPSPYSSDYLRRVEVRIDPFGVVIATRFTEAERTFGQAHTDPLRRRVTVEALDIVGSYEYTVDGTRYINDAGGDRQWVLVDVEVVNETDGSLDAPPPSTFTSSDGDVDYRALPVKGGTGYEASRLSWGSRTDGRIAFKTPQVSESELSVAWRATLDAGEVGIRWRPPGG